MALWLVRAGRHGEREQFALDNNVAVIGWDELGDISGVASYEEMIAAHQAAISDVGLNTARNWAAQAWAFLNRIQVGDLIVLPLKSRSQIAIGKVVGPYEYRRENPDGAHHVRGVEWLATDLPRSAFDQDLLYSFGAFMTVCQVSRNDAEARVRAMVSGTPYVSVTGGAITEEVGAEAETQVDVEEYSVDQIRSFLTRKFKGHDLARLVAAVLRAQGYFTLVSPEGPDGGVDIVAGRGQMGFDHPKLCVQVKSFDSPVDVSVLRELQGVMRNFGAEQGLLVNWGGFKSSVVAEARRQFFEMRLWDAGQLIDALKDSYEHLDSDIQAELPLKQIWVLAADAE